MQQDIGTGRVQFKSNGPPHPPRRTGYQYRFTDHNGSCSCSSKRRILIDITACRLVTRSIVGITQAIDTHPPPARRRMNETFVTEIHADV